MIKPPDWYLIAKRQLELEQRQPRRRRPPAEEITVLRSPRPRQVYASVTYRRTTSEQDRKDRRFCVILGSALLAHCLPLWAAAIAIVQQISA